MAYAPYNVFLDDKSPLLYYSPSRGGNSGYIDIVSDRSCWYTSNTTGRESSYTTYLLDASVALRWTGTAVWLYGEANATYTISRSWNVVDVTGTGAEASDGLLYSERDVAYGLHMLTLVVQQGPVTITGATVTVGMGKVGSTLTATNISALDVDAVQASSPINPFFTVSPIDAWHAYSVSSENGAQENLVNTYLQGAYVTFAVNSSLGFAIYGATAQPEGAYLVSEYHFNATSAWVFPDELKYPVTGLDRTQSYEVKIVNADAGRDFNLGQVVLFDAIPPVSTGSPSSDPTGSKPSGSLHSVLQAGTITGISVGSAVAFLIAAISAVLLYRYRRRMNAVSTRFSGEAIPRSEEGGISPAEVDNSLLSPSVTKSYMDCVPSRSFEVQSDARPTSIIKGAGQILETQSTSEPPGGQSALHAACRPSVPLREEDAGPVLDRLPPMYNPRWGDSSRSAATSDAQAMSGMEGGTFMPAIR